MNESRGSVLRSQLVALSLIALAGCSSKSDPPASTTKTCADLTKCCDGLAEPNKSVCTAATGGKQEATCAATYDKICLGSDGGSEGGTMSTADCDALKVQCTACANAMTKSSCDSAVTSGDEASCKALVDSNTYAASGMSCQP